MPMAIGVDRSYSEVEHETWRATVGNLNETHGRFACREYLSGWDRLRLPVDGVPRIQDINQQPDLCHGVGLVAAEGLSGGNSFFGRLENHQFPYIKSIRPPHEFAYTPTPDLIHDVVGHVTALGHVGYVEMSLAFGAAFSRSSRIERQQIVRLWWFTMEFGAVREAGAIKVAGAELLSSPAERGLHREDMYKPFSAFEAANTDYMAPGRRLLLADSFDDMKGQTIAFLSCL